MDQFPCPCGGETPNCFRCFGTGLIPSPVPIVGRPPRDLAQAAREIEAKNGKVRRKIKVRPKSGNRVVKVVSEVPVRAAAKPAALPAAPSYKKCPHCGLVLRSKQMGKHLLNVHGIDATGALICVKVAIAKEPTQCSLCGVMVKNQKKHLKKAHPKGSTQRTAPGRENIGRGGGKKSRQSTSMKGPISSKQSLDSASGTNGSDRDAAMDAKYRWGGSFRDHGQFGSYPSHDNMDDESSP